MLVYNSALPVGHGLCHAAGRSLTQPNALSIDHVPLTLPWFLGEPHQQAQAPSNPGRSITRNGRPPCTSHIHRLDGLKQ